MVAPKINTLVFFQKAVKHGILFKPYIILGSTGQYSNSITFACGWFMLKSKINS